jgi:hypothetical protein
LFGVSCIDARKRSSDGDEKAKGSAPKRACKSENEGEKKKGTVLVEEEEEEEEGEEEEEERKKDDDDDEGM